MTTNLITLKNKQIIKNLRTVRNKNKALAYTTTAPNTTNILTNKIVSSPFGSLLHSLSYSYDTTAQNNYELSITYIAPDFEEFSSTATIIDEVPGSKAIWLPPNTEIKFFAYNYNSATSNGTISILAVIEDLTGPGQQEVES